MQQLAKLKIKPTTTRSLSSAAIMTTKATSRCTTRLAAGWFCYFLSRPAIILLLLLVQASHTTSVQVISGSSDLAPAGAHDQWRPSNEDVGPAPAAAMTTSASDSPISSDTKTIGPPDSQLKKAGAVGVIYGEDDTTTTTAAECTDCNTTLIIDYDQQGYQLGQTTRQSITTALDDGTTVAPASRGGLSDTAAAAAAAANSSSSSSDGPGAATEQPRGRQDQEQAQDGGSVRRLRSSAESGETLRLGSGLNASSFSARQLKEEQELYRAFFKKTPYSKNWPAERKWDEVFKRVLTLGNKLKDSLARSLARDLEYVADVAISQACADDLRWTQQYQKKSSNFRWLLHMIDASGKSEPGMLTGQFAHLGHVIQCIKVRAPSILSNETFDDRYFDRQTEKLGEKFRGKYCLASIRPVLPGRPRLVSRFSELIDAASLSNISYLGESGAELKKRERQLEVPEFVRDQAAQHRHLAWLDQTPFESELYQYMIAQRNFMFNLPRVQGVCYPSSCSREDIQASLQKMMDDQHQVVDVEFECETEEADAWSWFTLPRLLVYVFLALVASLTLGASLARYLLVDKLRLRTRLLREGAPARGLYGPMFAALDVLSMDKCAGILFVKTKRATPIVDDTKAENLRSTTIDALKGALVLLLIYSELVYLGCLPVPFMWAKWNDAMFPFYRSLATQPFLNASIWSEAFYLISAYLIGAKLLESHRPRPQQQESGGELSNGLGSDPPRAQRQRAPHFGQFVMRRYVRLLLPMVAFMGLNYVWPRLSNGFVMGDQANKLMEPCDRLGWTNLLLFHNHGPLNDTCLWPSHVSAAFFQLHLLSYPILLLMLLALRLGAGSDEGAARKLIHFLLKYSGFGLAGALAALGLIYPAHLASSEQLVVPFLIDYLDYDNYRRVIERTLMPTHNHLVGYMLGLCLAYLVVARRAREERRRLAEQRRHSAASSAANYLEPEGSLESPLSTPSTTQGLHFRRPTSGGPNNLGASANAAPAAYATPAQSWWSRASSLLASLGLCLLLLGSLSASWLWNGLGQPMSARQTFWYMVATKLLFNLTFACLFYKHFATRRNSNEPWMITRFLVPIGRMSLTAFYTSWLVIWFDLLASLYQWHPSHYFVTEKFYEIIFITLVAAMFVYGAFEGSLRLVEIGKRNRRLRQLPLAKTSAGGSRQGFESFFLPQDDDDDDDDDDEAELAKSSGAGSFPVGNMTNSDRHQQQLMATTNAAGKRNKMLAGHHQSRPGDNGGALAGQTKATSGARLSIVDQYKLNAELRANYSFASIGLYETAPGAADEFTHPAAAGCDPQVSSAAPARPPQAGPGRPH